MKRKLALTCAAVLGASLFGLTPAEARQPPYENGSGSGAGGGSSSHTCGPSSKIKCS